MADGVIENQTASSRVDRVSQRSANARPALAVLSLCVVFCMTVSNAKVGVDRHRTAIVW
jgi:hypothetical protein